MLKMVITDLDGTLLNSEQKVSQTDFETLIELGKRGIVRVIATGRSPFSFNRVIPADFPIDYLVFSSGTGVMNFKSKEVYYAKSIDHEKVKELATIFHQLGISFKVLSPVPDNHLYTYFENGNSHPDFYRRMEFYRGFESPISFDPPNFGDASQLLIILPEDLELFNKLKEKCSGVKVVRATSPLDHRSIWMEIFHQDVSKALGVSYLCQMLAIDPMDTIGIGNDYNDIDLLAFTGRSFVVENAPADLCEQCVRVASHDEHGFSAAVSSMLHA